MELRGTDAGTERGTGLSPVGLGGLDGLDLDDPADPDLGLRERKKLQTRRRLWRVAVELFSERGFDHVSVAEIAAAAEVSKMTVFNYFGTKEELVLGPWEEHIDDVARVVRERPPGESAVAAVRRQFLEALAVRDASVGLSDNPAVLQVRHLVGRTPALLARAVSFSARSVDLLAQALEAETGDPVLAQIAAAQLAAARLALIQSNHRRLSAGEPVPAVARTSAEEVERAFDFLETGLRGYAIR